MATSSFQLPNDPAFNGPIGLSANTSGGLNSPVYSSAPSNPINYGYTVPAQTVAGAATATNPTTNNNNNSNNSNNNSSSGSMSQDQKNALFQKLGLGQIAPVGWNGPATGAQGVSQDDINAAYDPVFSDINNLYNTANTNHDTYINAATTPFDALQPGIDQSYTSGMNLNQTQSSQEAGRQQNALASARQLYNELSQGVQQRFGGAGSTSDFAKAFYGRQLQQNEGGIYNTSGNNFQDLATQAANIVSQHGKDTQTLAAQKASAQANAELQFKNMLQQIDQLKTQTDQQKAQAKLDALTQLKATANAINSQFSQFQQQLQLQNQSGLDQLRNQIAYGQSLTGQPVNLSAYNSLLASQVGTPGQSSYNPYNISGQISPTQKNQYGY